MSPNKYGGTADPGGLEWGYWGPRKGKGLGVKSQHPNRGSPANRGQKYLMKIGRIVGTPWVLVRDRCLV